MKQAKFMLTGLAILAVVGGALAFKAKAFLPGNVFCSTFGAPNTCQAVIFQTTNPGDEATITNPCGGTTTTFYTEGSCITSHKSNVVDVYPTPTGN